jgi:hypothetical protein
MKKVQVTVNEEVTKPSKPTVSVIVENSAPKVDFLGEILYLLSKNKITILNIKENKNRLDSIVSKYIQDKKLSREQVKDVIEKLPQKLYEVTYSK